MYLNKQSIKIIEEIAKASQTKSNIVKAWARKYNLDVKTLEIFWRRSELKAAQGKKCKCIPWAVATDIFKLSIRKYFDLKGSRKDIESPKIDGEKVQTHKSKEPISDVVKRYKTEIKKLEKACPNFDKLPDCSFKSLNENLNI